MAAGLLALVAAHRLYHQRGYGLGLLAAGVNVIAVSAWVLGPLLALGSLTLAFLAHREGGILGSGRARRRG